MTFYLTLTSKLHVITRARFESTGMPKLEANSSFPIRITQLNNTLSLCETSNIFTLQNNGNQHIPDLITQKYQE